mmetsp:Transcript_49977/g.106315  ORF Transcript_49977/g.106315 Transcript_49977/m.106315 type:complete len:80 (-) Transcript_49977:118-357(-)
MQTSWARPDLIGSLEDQLGLLTLKTMLCSQWGWRLSLWAYSLADCRLSSADQPGGRSPKSMSQLLCIFLMSSPSYSMLK